MSRIGSTLAGVDRAIQNNLLRAFSQLNESTLRLSTLRRINRGSDDPAGLIAYEQLRSELTAVNRAQTNAARATSVVRTADSGLSQISGLLNTIRDRLLASAGTTSKAERAANQIEINAALEAINRIGRSSSFGGRPLLNGSAGFQADGVNNAQVSDIQVFSRAGGTQTTLDVEVTAAATSAQLDLVVDPGGLAEDTTLVVQSGEGTVAVELSAGASADDIAAAINAATGSTGAAATVDGDTVTVASADVGSAATLSVEAISGSISGTGNASGSDIVAHVNGTEFTGQGNTLEIRTAAVQVDLTLIAGFTGTADTITISGDALTFLLSQNPGDAVALALPNISTAALGGAAGRLSELTAGGGASLSSGNLQQAIDILDQASSQVLGARGRLGAFEKSTIGSSLAVLASAEVNLSDAISQIVDLDVAAETSRLVRNRILASAAVATAALANQNRRSISSLLDIFG